MGDLAMPITCPVSKRFDGAATAGRSAVTDAAGRADMIVRRPDLPMEHDAEGHAGACPTARSPTQLTHPHLFLYCSHFPTRPARGSR